MCAQAIDYISNPINIIGNVISEDHKLLLFDSQSYNLRISFNINKDNRIHDEVLKRLP